MLGRLLFILHKPTKRIPYLSTKRVYETGAGSFDSKIQEVVKGLDKYQRRKQQGGAYAKYK